MLRKGSVLLSYRQIAERFWAPFSQGIKGADVTRYKAKENLALLVNKRRNEAHRMPEATGPATANRLDSSMDFTCQVNDIFGNLETVENMFITILTGFDIVKVVMDPSPENSPSIKGTIYVKHSRCFIGWRPTDTTIYFPFSMFIEGNPTENTISHLVLHFHFDDALKSAGCPKEVMLTLSDRDSLKMLAALRRIRVKPEAITHAALASAAQEKASWQKALGLLE